jgi:hypothetical protein
MIDLAADQWRMLQSLGFVDDEGSAPTAPKLDATADDEDGALHGSTRSQDGRRHF